MKTFLKILQVVLMVFGVLFVAFAVWMIVVDPLGLRNAPAPAPAPSASELNSDVPSMPDSPDLPPGPPAQPAPEPIPSAEPVSADAETGLTPSQEAALKAVGIEPEAVTNITPEQEACLREAVGDQRAEEIVGGATPTVIELIKGKQCL